MTDYDIDALLTDESKWPLEYDKQGNDYFVCPACKGWGYFVRGNGGIEHQADCPIVALLLQHALAEETLSADEPLSDYWHRGFKQYEY